MEDNQDLAVRNFDIVSDQAFVIDSWMKSFYPNSPFCEFIDRKEYRFRHLPIIKRLLETSAILLMVESDSPGVIIGYIVYEPEVLHYLYVKEGFRGFGIASKLLQRANFPDRSRVTHMTYRGKKIAQKRGFIYSPYF